MMISHLLASGAHGATPAGVGTARPRPTMAELGERGYRLEVVALGAWSCTKPDEPTYTCDAYGRCSIAQP